MARGRSSDGAGYASSVSEAVREILILGGGSAGWITAATLAAEFRISRPGTRVSVIESPDLPAIGVGEGTWPSMRGTLHAAGLSEAELVRECDAAFKQGSRFDGWVDGGAADRYYHPFTLPQGFGEADLVGAWLQGEPGQAFAASVGPQPPVCDAALAPKQTTTPAYGGALNYGYHFDAVKIGQLLRRHAVERLGVRHIADEVVAVSPGGRWLVGAAGTPVTFGIYDRTAPSAPPVPLPQMTELASSAVAFDDAHPRPMVSWRITIGLYWARPWQFLPLDAQSRNYIINALSVPQLRDLIETQVNGVPQH